MNNKKKSWGKDDLQTLSETIDSYLCTDTLIFKKYANLAQPENGRFIFKAIIVSVRGFKALVSHRWFLYVHPKWGAAQSSDAKPSTSLLCTHKVFAALHPLHPLIWKALAAFQLMQKHQLLLGMLTWSVCTLDSVRASRCLRVFEQTPLCLNVYQTVLQLRLQIKLGSFGNCNGKVCSVWPFEGNTASPQWAFDQIL